MCEAPNMAIAAVAAVVPLEARRERVQDCVDAPTSPQDK